MNKHLSIRQAALVGGLNGGHPLYSLRIEAGKTRRVKLAWSVRLSIPRRRQPRNGLLRSGMPQIVHGSPVPPATAPVHLTYLYGYETELARSFIVVYGLQPTHITPELLSLNPPLLHATRRHPAGSSASGGAGTLNLLQDAKDCRVAGAGPRPKQLYCNLSITSDHEYDCGCGGGSYCSGCGPAPSPRRTPLSITGDSPLSARAPHSSPAD